MVGNKLNILYQEIDHYLNLPYSKNVLKNGKIIKEQVLGGKGYWKDIDTETQKIAKLQHVDLSIITPKQLYQFQKKNHIGIDCSGLVCQLLNFYFKTHLDPRKTSANMLTSTPLSFSITNPNDLSTGDLVRQKDGHHVLFIIEKSGDTVKYVDSSLWGRGVKYGQFKIDDSSFEHQGFFRLFLFN